jgi:hypothetical protein
VLDDFFKCTPVGANQSSLYGHIFTSSCDTKALKALAPIQYVYVDYRDILYAEAPEHVCPDKPFPVPVTATDTKPACWSLEDLLGQTTWDLLEMAGQKPFLPAFTCIHKPISFGVFSSCQPAIQ